MYLALYRKFRPKSFNKIIGQNHIVQTLKNQIKTRIFFLLESPSKSAIIVNAGIVR